MEEKTPVGPRLRLVRRHCPDGSEAVLPVNYFLTTTHVRPKDRLLDLEGVTDHHQVLRALQQPVLRLKLRPDQDRNRGSRSIELRPTPVEQDSLCLVFVPVFNGTF